MPDVTWIPLQRGAAVELPDGQLLEALEVTETQALFRRLDELDVAVPHRIDLDGTDAFLAVTYISGRRYLCKIYEAEQPEADLSRAFIVS